MSKQAIVMLSIGERPWAQAAFESFKWIARSWTDVEAHLITSDEADDLDTSGLSTQKGRPNKRAYALKSYYPWRFFNDCDYNKILMVDDSCIIHPATPNIFEIYSESQLAYAVTSSRHAARSFGHIEALIESENLDEVGYDAKKYGNSGVVLYDREFSQHTTPDKIADARACLDAAFPHQTLLYYLIARSGVSPSMLSRHWNAAVDVPDGVDRAYITEARPHLNPKTFITHITGHYKNRNDLVRDVAEHYRGQRPQVSAALHSTDLDRSGIPESGPVN